ncbi:MAG: CoA pyrophosphatase [Ancrocorticia sp.]
MGIEQLRESVRVNDLTGYVLDRSGARRRSAGGAASRRNRGSDDPLRKAAVLILLSESGGDALLAEPNIDVVLTERSSTLRSHPSQVAFPGGRLDPGEGAIDAALREANEEVGLDPALVSVLGTLPPSHVNASSFDVTAVVGTWNGNERLVAGDPAEVASVHRVSIDELAAPENRFSATLPMGYRGPAFSANGLFIWGFTAHLLTDVLDLGGWAQPWDEHHEIEVPPRLWRS